MLDACGVQIEMTKLTYSKRYNQVTLGGGGGGQRSVKSGSVITLRVLKCFVKFLEPGSMVPAISGSIIVIAVSM